MKKMTSFTIVSVVLLGSLAVAEVALARSPIKVVGTVTGVNLTVPPQILVVKTPLANGRTLIVGCRLNHTTVIKVGDRPEKLDEFHVGDRVHLTYNRVEDGLVCDTIAKREATMMKQTG
jgi:hypothetical protein